MEVVYPSAIAVLSRQRTTSENQLALARCRNVQSQKVSPKGGVVSALAFGDVTSLEKNKFTQSGIMVCEERKTENTNSACGYSSGRVRSVVALTVSCTRDANVPCNTSKPLEGEKSDSMFLRTLHPPTANPLSKDSTPSGVEVSRSSRCRRWPQRAARRARYLTRKGPARILDSSSTTPSRRSQSKSRQAPPWSAG